MYKEFKMKKKMKNVFARSMQMCTGAKLKKSVGGVHNAELPTNRRHSSPICRQRGLSLSFVGSVDEHYRYSATMLNIGSDT